jgi:hypothetical protein
MHRDGRADRLDERVICQFDIMLNGSSRANQAMCGA